MQNPIRRISSRQIYEGRLVRVREDSVILPRGTKAVYEHVEIKHGASALPLEENGDVWLGREWRYAINRPSLEVFSGGIEPDEQPLHAAQRELREEAGLTAREWIPMGCVDPFTSMLVCPSHLFLARGLSIVEPNREEGEVMELSRMPLQQAVDLVMRGEITHGSSCVLILKASQWLKGSGGPVSPFAALPGKEVN